MKIENIKRGDILRHKGKYPSSYVVDDNYGEFVIAVRTIRIDNPDEWEIVKEATPK